MVVVVRVGRGGGWRTQSDILSFVAADAITTFSYVNEIDNFYEELESTRRQINL